MWVIESALRRGAGPVPVLSDAIMHSRVGRAHAMTERCLYSTSVAPGQAIIVRHWIRVLLLRYWKQLRNYLTDMGYDCLQTSLLKIRGMGKLRIPTEVGQPFRFEVGHPVGDGRSISG
jgi:hypothetical protein